MTGEARFMVRASVLGLLLAGVSTAVLAAPDPREARIEQLEAQVRQLMADRVRIEAQDEQLLAQTRDLAARKDHRRAQIRVGWPAILTHDRLSLTT